MDDLKLTEKDFDDLIDAVNQWGKNAPGAIDSASAIIANILSDQRTDKIEHLLREKKVEYERSRRQRERDAALLSAKIILIQKAFLDSPSTFDLKEHLR